MRVDTKNKKSNKKQRQGEKAKPIYAGLGERALVNKYIEKLEAEHKCFVIVDRDSKARVFKSGFDFQVIFQARLYGYSPGTIYFEAKKVPNVDKPPIDPHGLLTDFQSLTRAQILAVGGTYIILLLDENGGWSWVK